MRPLEALSPAVRLEAQLLSTFIKSATAPPSATASLYAVFVESAIAQSAFADSSIISSGLPAGNERGNQHAIRGGAQGAIRGPSGSLQAMSEDISIEELACRRTATNLEAFLDDRAEERDGSAAYESSLVVRLAATEHPYRTRRVDLMVVAIRRVLRAHPSSSELGEDCDRHQSWARIAIVIRAGR
jgi:hypothetical protein